MIKHLNADEKWNLLNNLDDALCLSEDEIDFILQLTNDSDPDVRIRSAQLLAQVPSHIAQPVLLALLQDGDDLVRVNACDSLSNCPTRESLVSLKRIAKQDRIYLVRGYAVISIGDISFQLPLEKETTKLFLLNGYAHEKSTWVKISYSYALYLAGIKEYSQFILDQVNNRYYHIRCHAIQMLHYLMNPDLAEDSISILEDRLKIETSLAVLQRIQNLLKKIASLK